jgi:hypothetical protein
MSSSSPWTLLLCASMSLLLGVSGSLAPDSGRQAKSAAPAASKTADGPAKQAVQRIDLSTAMNVNLPATSRDLEATSFGTPDGKSGWVLRLPGGRPIATPAYADGMLFVGGGYGSHEFYAVDSETGKIIWKIQTGDDGPTAAAVADGMVAFNTESCTLVVVEERRGRVIWQEWLGDPLMSQPAIGQGRVVYRPPGGHGAAPEAHGVSSAACVAGRQPPAARGGTQHGPAHLGAGNFGRRHHRTRYLRRNGLFHDV